MNIKIRELQLDFEIEFFNIEDFSFPFDKIEYEIIENTILTTFTATSLTGKSKKIEIAKFITIKESVNILYLYLKSLSPIQFKKFIKKYIKERCKTQLSFIRY